MNTTIYLLRHGEVYNPNGIFYVRLPRFGISPKGKEQIHEVANYLKKEHVDLLYSSPLLRARQSARVLQQDLKVSTIHYSASILEIRTSLQGRTLEFMHSINFNTFDPKYFKKTDETLEEVAARMVSFINKLTKRYPNQHIAIVSHGDAILTLKATIQHKPLLLSVIHKQPYLRHGEVLKITKDDAGELSIESVFYPRSQ
jgi:broad specificity phosphatase PhoE